ncbi:MAG: formylmethanofuran dehydrogenase subunit E family protein [Alistipes sp.]|nr:formylmethanofuran dehydrogenase subunit E family protein [Alistipes sp.]
MIHNDVFDTFPLSADLYAADVAAICERTIARYGSDEWRKVTLTNALHGHLGIYSTLGAKMGLRACEEMARDEMEIISLAGSRPPMSCMNDGLQVATGSTLGHGLITATLSHNPRPVALFHTSERSFLLALKSTHLRQIQHDIAECILRNSPDSEGYWADVRSLAIGYWEQMDRHEIFDLVPLPIGSRSVSAKSSTARVNV